MYNTNTASVNTAVKVTALTSDTLYRLAAILKGNRYATIETTEAEVKAIESNAYAANMGAEGKEAAWVRFCELCLSDLNGKDISEEVKERIGCALNLDRYTVAAYCSEEDSEADTDIIEENSYSTAAEAINAAKERIREAEEDNEAIRVAVYTTEDETLYEGITTGTAYRLFEDYASPTIGAVAYSAEEAAQALSDWLCDSYEGEEAYKEMLDECNEMVTIGSLTYYPSIALERIDPTAYRCGLTDWADAEYKDALYEIERMEYGDTVSRYGWNCKLVHIAEEIDYTADNSEWAVCR